MIAPSSMKNGATSLVAAAIATRNPLPLPGYSPSSLDTMWRTPSLVPTTTAVSPSWSSKSFGGEGTDRPSRITATIEALTSPTPSSPMPGRSRRGLGDLDPVDGQSLHGLLELGEVLGDMGTAKELGQGSHVVLLQAKGLPAGVRVLLVVDQELAVTGPVRDHADTLSPRRVTKSWRTPTPGSWSPTCDMTP